MDSGEILHNCGFWDNVTDNRSNFYWKWWKKGETLNSILAEANLFCWFENGDIFMDLKIERVSDKHWECHLDMPMELWLTKK